MRELLFLNPLPQPSRDYNLLLDSVSTYPRKHLPLPLRLALGLGLLIP